MEHEARGRHALVDLHSAHEKAPTVLDHAEYLEGLMRGAAEAAGATILHGTRYTFEPQGVTVVLTLAESHASLHSYPERGGLFVDFFTCGAVDPDVALDNLIHQLSLRLPGIRVVRRLTLARST